MIQLKKITCYNYSDLPLKIPSGLNPLDGGEEYHNKYILTWRTTILLLTSNIGFKFDLLVVSVIHKFC